MEKNFSIWLLLLTGVILAGCRKRCDRDEAPLKLVSVTGHAKGGDIIELEGEGFALSANENKVTINGVAAQVVEASTARLKAEVPSMAGSGKVMVQIGDKESETLDFIYDWIYTVSTFAGTGDPSVLHRPLGIAVDDDGVVYVSEHENHRICKITQDGTIGVLAGSTESGNRDGQGTAARFENPAGICLDAQGNLIVADMTNRQIRKVSQAGAVSTMFGTVAGSAPADVAVDKQGALYLADYAKPTLRKYSVTGQELAAISRSKFGPTGLAIDKLGMVYVSENISYSIGVITSDASFKVIAGGKNGLEDGQGAAATFIDPRGIAVDKDGYLWVSDMEANCIRLVSPSGLVSTSAGNHSGGYKDGSGSIAQFSFPRGVDIGKDGSVYVADYLNNRVRKITRK